MSIQPGSLGPSIERIPALPAVRPVERDRGADEFNQKQPNAQDGTPSEQEQTDDALPEDVVDLSGDYETANLPDAVPVSRPAVSPPHALPSAAEPHIDIEG